jgi:hypothetical protein
VRDGSDTVIPFAADVSLEVVPTIQVAHRVDPGAVRSRRVQQLATAPDGRTAFSTLGRLWVTERAGGPALGKMVSRG